MTNIPKAHELINRAIDRIVFQAPRDARPFLEEALELMTRKVNKKRVMINRMTPDTRNKIAELIRLNDHLQDSEIAAQVGFTGAGAARVSEIRNGLL